MGEEQKVFAGCSKVASPSVAYLVRYAAGSEGCLPLLKLDLSTKVILAL